ncbi:hypothetical protein JBKA6_1376 [Ichthyobacterium seriolicida]|uniref:Uncharacterized protein n=1 Tax=Ichthyobacterium seriolicida TaxID=242600 RepID=A0A1J1E343_9FLAO|nr:hypothetical protein JBKA6_1376 [Ichthyobacterium seriolicida]
MKKKVLVLRSAFEGLMMWFERADLRKHIDILDSLERGGH